MKIIFSVKVERYFFVTENRRSPHSPVTIIVLRHRHSMFLYLL
ncbi:hypothetical protein CFter6_0416 [Collimonas fungivorans]|uniref:Uncharacterized protein n=1 Tax=Collimonas fungivorans TaxID=158899 RepID=A0A127P5Y9_9BURK|nr:hypothetical protein CFter6_0416 [Collimonas fungivorans]